MNRFLVIGSNFTGLKKALASHGHDYITLKDVLKIKHPEVVTPKQVPCDFSSKESVLAAVDTITEPIDAVITVYENYIRPASWVADHLNLPGLPLEAAEACTDKQFMRELFSTCETKISPDFTVVNNEDELLRFADTHTFPLILKPANLVKSLLVSKCSTREELIETYKHTVEQMPGIYKKYAPNREPKLLIEEFLEGTIHSVDAFVDADGTPHVLEHVVDYLTGYDIGYEDNFHYARLLPSKLSSEKIEAIRHTAELGCRALGMKNSAAHVEIILTKAGPRVVEIGARNGGYRERMHRLANDIDLMPIAFDVALNKKPIITSHANRSCAVLELFPRTPGIFTGINNEDAVKGLISLQYFALKQTVGEYVGSSSNGYKMCAIIILAHESRKQFEQDLTFVNKSVFVTTRLRTV